MTTARRIVAPEATADHSRRPVRRRPVRRRPRGTAPTGDAAGTATSGGPPRGGHLPPYSEPASAADGQTGPEPRKLTVTRVAALRSRELTNKGVQMFHRAATADGADRSGLTHLTYAVMANYAVDAALAVALANTLFFAAATAESTGKVLLYLLITVAPFAVIAPFIGPMLDRMQHGRRLALAVVQFRPRPCWRSDGVQLRLRGCSTRARWECWCCPSRSACSRRR